MIHQGLIAEERGMRLTGKAPTCLSICKKEFGFKGNRTAIRKQLETYMISVGGCEDYLSRCGLGSGVGDAPKAPVKTCGKCGARILSPGPCPGCDDHGGYGKCTED